MFTRGLTFLPMPEVVLLHLDEENEYEDNPVFCNEDEEIGDYLEDNYESTR